VAKGIKTINEAIEVFAKVEKKLAKGITQCTEEKEKKNIEIAKLNAQVGEVDVSQKRAERVLLKIQEIIA